MIFPAAVICSLLGADARLSATAAELADARDSITQEELRDHVAFLASDTLEGRAAGSDGGRAAAAYLADAFRSLGLQPVGDDFRQEYGESGHQNVIARWGGDADDPNEPAPIIVSGHYDHVGRGSWWNRIKPRHRVVTAPPLPRIAPKGPVHNGADDNASGTSLVLEIAEACSQLPPPRRPVFFALWDGEEVGLVGSGEYALQTEEDPAALVIVTDMVGRASCDRVYVYGSTTVPGLEDVVAAAAAETQAVDGPLQAIFLHEHLPRSDHWPFYKRGVPYLFLNTGLHPQYHQPEDDADLLNYPVMEAIGRTMFTVLMGVMDEDFTIELDPASKELPTTMLPPQSVCPSAEDTADDSEADQSDADESDASGSQKAD